MRQLPGRTREGSQAAAPLRGRARLPAPGVGRRRRREHLRRPSDPVERPARLDAASLAAARRDLREIFAAALRAVDPVRLVRDHLAVHPLRPPRADERLLVVGAGKAAARMAAGVEDALTAARVRGVVVTAAGCEVPLGSIRIAFGSHPLPNGHSLTATSELVDALRTLPVDNSPLLCLISGGASSLLAQPRSPLALADKLIVNRLLLACGADIDAVNAVRKHLSLVKGGGLLRLAGGRPVRTLILSDVIGDDPSVIGSGPSVPDPTTHADALAVLDRFDLRIRVPPAVRALLEAGARGEIAETVKAGDAEAERAEAALIGSNRIARQAAAARAAELGYEAMVDDQELSGDTTVAARGWAERIAALPAGRRWCAVAGGETTVVVRGCGRGGRNQEFALTAAEVLAGVPIALLSAGTDCIDGPTDAAGAIADGQTAERARALGLDPARTLAENDSYAYFDRLGDLLHTGPTGTNVMDLKLAVGVGSAR